MIRVLCDTNFLLDVVLEHRPGADSAFRLFELIAGGRVAGALSPTSLKDFYYIARREIAEETRREYIDLFLDAFEIVDIGRNACRFALECDEPDFEDGLVRAAAELDDFDYIVSRDARAFLSSRVKRVSAEGLLNEFPGGVR